MRLLIFLHDLQVNDKTDSGAKAAGYFTILQEFKTVLMLYFLIFIFERVETLNAALQRTKLNIHEALSNVTQCRNALLQKRVKGFQEVWKQSVKFAEEHDVGEPELPRIRKRCQRYDTGNAEHVFKSPEDLFRPLYMEVVDTTIRVRGLRDRFNNTTTGHLSMMEDFILGRSDGTDVCHIYGDDLDKNRLVLHRDMLRDIAASEGKGSAFDSVNKYLDYVMSESRSPTLTMLPEFEKFIGLFLTIQMSSYCAERSFSALRGLKTFLRSAMTKQCNYYTRQSRLIPQSGSKEGRG